MELNKDVYMVSEDTPKEDEKDAELPFLEDLISQGDKKIDSIVIQEHCFLQREAETDKGKGSSIAAKSNSRTGWRRYLGLIYTLISTNMFSVSSIILKKITHIHPFNLGTWVFPVSAILSVPFIIYTITIEKKPVLTNLIPLRKNKKVAIFVIIRSVLSVGITYMLFITFKYITVADTRTILAAAVITVYFFGWLFLGEKCGIVPIITAIIALLGIGVIARPPMLTGQEGFDTDTLIGVGLAVTCMLIGTGIIISLRILAGVHHGVLNCFLYTWAVCQSVILGLIWGKLSLPESWYDWGIMTTIGVLMILGNTFLVLALQEEEAGVVALYRCSEVIFTFTWQMVILGVYPDYLSLIGAVLVLTGVIVVTLRKYLSSLPEDNLTRRRLALLLK